MLDFNDTTQPVEPRHILHDSERAELLKPRGANQTKSVHEKYGSDMGWWRALTRFQRKYAPEVSKGMAVYTPDEAYEISRPIDTDWVEREAALMAAAREKEKANDPAEQ